MTPSAAGKRRPGVKTIGLLLGITCIIAAGIWLLPWRGSVGTLEIEVKDHREAIDDFAQLELHIKRLRIASRPSANSTTPAWRELAPQVSSLDLTRFTGGQTLRLYRGELKPGAFEAVHLELSRVNGMLRNNLRPAPIENRVSPIQILFSVRPRVRSRIVLDLVVLDVSDHPPRGYELHIKGYELYEAGRLIDRVPPE